MLKTKIHAGQSFNTFFVSLCVHVKSQEQETKKADLNRNLILSCIWHHQFPSSVFLETDNDSEEINNYCTKDNTIKMVNK